MFAKWLIFTKNDTVQIVLWGYMGSGKSTVGVLLAKALNCDFIDLDVYIEQGEGISVPEIFAGKGEVYFRRKEHEYLKELLSRKSNFVLALGGGTPCYTHNLALLQTGSAVTVYLKVPLNILVERLSTQKAQRPLIRYLSDAELPEFIGKHLFERSYYYNQASLKIDCGGKLPESVVSELLEILERSGSLG